MQELPEKQIGEALQAARVDAGLEILQVARTLHIRKHYIEALEEGTLSELPGSIYARGYLKRYSDFLQLDTAEILAVFDRIGLPTHRRFFQFAQSLDRSPHPSRKLVMVSSLLALGIMTGWSIWHAREPVSPVLAFIPPGSSLTPNPDRCVYSHTLPCYWERFELWYRPSRDAVKSPVEK